MSFKVISIGAAALLACAMPAAAQQRGTVELGAFASGGSFDQHLTLKSGVGAGGHVGIFLDPRLAIEFEGGEMRASRTSGLADANVGILTSRLVLTPFSAGALSFMIGAGAAAGTETSFMHSYGVDALLGAKLALTNNAAVRVDVISDWLANNHWQSYRSLHVGISLYRSPFERTVVRTVEVPVAAAPYVQQPDSVSASEQARRRRFEIDYVALRDSLSRVPVVPVSSAAALATMQEMIHFATDKSILTPDSKAILDAKVPVFLANPAMRIVVVGNTDERASDEYNMALGRRRSAAAKEYLVSKGIDPVRIEVETAGERHPIAAGTTRPAQAQNRRDEFRLLVASDFLVPPM